MDPEQPSRVEISAGRWGIRASGREAILVLLITAMLAAGAYVVVLQSREHKEIVRELQRQTCVTSIPVETRQQFRSTLAAAQTQRALELIMRSWCPWLDLEGSFNRADLIAIKHNRRIS